MCVHTTFSEKTVHWGLLHVLMTHDFKNYINITFIDESFNLCDLCTQVIEAHCPLHPGVYHFHHTTTMSELLWPVSNGM